MGIFIDDIINLENRRMFILKNNNNRLYFKNNPSTNELEERKRRISRITTKYKQNLYLNLQHKLICDSVKHIYNNRKFRTKKEFLRYVIKYCTDIDIKNQYKQLYKNKKLRDKIVFPYLMLI